MKHLKRQMYNVHSMLKMCDSGANLSGHVKHWKQQLYLARRCTELGQHVIPLLLITTLRESRSD